MHFAGSYHIQSLSPESDWGGMSQVCSEPGLSPQLHFHEVLSGPELQPRKRLATSSS